MKDFAIGESEDQCRIDTDGILHWKHHLYWTVDGTIVAYADTVIDCPFDAIGTVAQWLPHKPSVVFVGDVRCHLIGSGLAVEGMRLKVQGAGGIGESPDAVFLNEDQTRRLIAGDKRAADEAVEAHYRDRPLREELVAGLAPRYAETEGEEE